MTNTGPDEHQASQERAVMHGEDAVGQPPSRAVSEQACSGCRQAHALCDRKKPCGRCVQLGKADTCRPCPARKRGRPRKATGDQQNLPPTAWLPITKAQQPTLSGSHVFAPVVVSPSIHSPSSAPLGPRLAAATPLAPRPSVDTSPPSSEEGASKRPKKARTTPHTAQRADSCDTRHDGAEPAITKALMLMLVDEVRGVKEENRQLRDKVAELRGQRKRDRAEMRAMENRLQNMEQSMQAMATAQQESAAQMTRFFQQKPLPSSPRHATSAPQPPSALLTGSLTTTSSSTTVTPTALSSLPQRYDSPPWQSSSFAGSGLPAYSMSGRMHGWAGLLHALPYLRDFDPGLLLVSDLSQPFMVLSMTHPETLADMMPPTIKFVSPGAAAFLGYSHEEIVGKSIQVLGCIDIQDKLSLMQDKLSLMHAMFSKSAPPSGVSDPLRIYPVLRRKGCEPARIESFHQYLWVNSRVQWNIALLTRVLEEGVSIPQLGGMSELLSNPSTRALFSRLAPSLRQPLDRARICTTTIDTSSSESSSSSSWSEASGQEETILGLQQSSMDLDIELQEMMRALRSPSPSTGPPADDHERWLL